MQKSELILPGGDLERVKIAFQYGADAVYLGLNKYSLRKTEVRFNFSEIKQAIDYGHKLGKRVFVTFNIFAHNQNLAELRRDLKKVADYQPDAFIIADPGVLAISQRLAPKIPIHLSTQANSLNVETVLFWQKQGVKRIVLARELTLEEIKEIHNKVPGMELEVFVHGAMCISYSGRCLLSNYMTGREANMGDCAQPCRWDYNVYLEETKRPGEYYPVEESESGTYLMGSKDLRLIRYLPELLDAGVAGFKVEGRNKSEYYLATTARAYQEALRLIESTKYTEKAKIELEKELEKLNYRDYTTGFIFNDAKLGEVANSRRPKKTWDYLGIITKNELQITNQCEILVKNKVKVRDNIEVLTPTGIFQDKIYQIADLQNNKLIEASPGKEDQKAYIKLSKEYPPNSIVRKSLHQRSDL